MGDLGGDVDDARLAFQDGQVVGEALPGERHAFRQGHTRDFLHTFHQFDQLVLLARPQGRKADTAIAGDHGGHPVARAGAELRIPAGLTVVVGVDIDKAWGDDRPLRVDHGGAFGSHAADFRDQAILDCDIRDIGGAAGAVIDHAAADDEIIPHVPTLPCRIRCP